jgi:methylated-DNA-[protein]-cysteine S-methyltransferase
MRATIREIREPENLAEGVVMTWAGGVRVLASPAGVRVAEIPRWEPSRAEAPADLGAMTIRTVGDAAAERHLRQALAELREFFAGERQVFTVALAPHATDFYRAAWAEVARVPFGETRSYGEIARAIGAPTAVRAVGAANGANPVAPFVPCHRIVGSDGRLTGYGPGLPLKARLLAMEGAVPRSSDDYDRWAATLDARYDGRPVVLGIRSSQRYCAPGCVGSRARWQTPARIFASAAEAEAADYAPCPACGGAR